MTQFTEHELQLLWECVESKLSVLYERRIQLKISGEWDDDDWAEDHYWEIFNRYKPLWDKLNTNNKISSKE